MGSLFSSSAEELEFVGYEKNHLGQKVAKFKNSNGNVIKKVNGTTLKLPTAKSVEKEYKDYLDKQEKIKIEAIDYAKEFMDVSVSSHISKNISAELMKKYNYRDKTYGYQVKNMMYADGVSKFSDVSFGTFDALCQCKSDPF